MATSFKRGTATVAAIAFLLYGVEVAHAGGIGDVVNDVPAVAESTLPAALDTSVGDVVAEATEAVEDVAPVDAMAVVSDAKETVDGAVADPKGVVASTVEQVSRTVDEVAGDATVDKVLELSPVGKAPPGVADTAKPIASTVQAPDASGSEAVGPAPSRQQPESVQPLVSQAQNSLETGAATEPARLAWRANPPRIAIRATVTSPGNSVQRPLPTRTGLPPPLATWDDAFGSPELTASHDASSVVSEAPLTPPAPGDQPATAASVVGAAGAALLAALFSAFLFLAPRRRRSIRPGPILVWPDPCLSLAERPG